MSNVCTFQINKTWLLCGFIFYFWVNRIQPAKLTNWSLLLLNIYKKIITFDTFIILVIISGSCNEKLLGNIITFVAYGTWHMRSVVAWSLSPGYQRWYNTLARHKASNPSCQVSLFVLSHLIISYQMRFSKVGKHLLNVLKSLFCFSCTNKSNLFFLEFGKIWRIHKKIWKLVFQWENCNH